MYKTSALLNTISRLDPLSDFVNRTKSAEDELYELPDHIKAIISQRKKNEDMLSNQMLSGIPEVELGIE